MRMLVLLYTVLAMEGTWRLARWWGASATAALFAGLFFGLSGRFIQAIDDGQPVFYAFALFPWVVWSFERGLLSWRYALIGGGWMAWLFLEGGAVPTPHTAVQLG